MLHFLTNAFVSHFIAALVGAGVSAYYSHRAQAKAIEQMIANFTADVKKTAEGISQK